MAGIHPLSRSVRRWGRSGFTDDHAYGIHYGNRRTLEYLACGPDEQR